MRTALSGPLLVAGSDLTANDQYAMHDIGSVAFTNDGRKFVYSRFVAQSVPGNVYQAAVEITNHEALVAKTAAIGVTSLTVTLGGTAATVNQYQGGLVVITTGTGAGQCLKIDSNPAQTGTTSDLALVLGDPLTIATLTADSKADLKPNKFNNVILNPASATSAPAGVAVSIVSAGYCGWLQVSGPCAILNDSEGAITVGGYVIPSDTAAGSLEAISAYTDIVLGVALTGIAASEYGLVDLKL